MWEIATGRCVGALNVTSGGHTEAVSCLEHIPAIPQAPAVAPGEFPHNGVVSFVFDLNIYAF